AGGTVVLFRVVPRAVPCGAAGALPAARRARPRVVRGGALAPPASRRGGGRRADVGRGASSPRPAGAPAPLLPHLPDARRSAVPRSEARSVATAAGLDLLLRSRSHGRQLRRGPGPRDERARMALDLVRSDVERRARVHAARRHGSDAGRLRARRHGHLPERVPPQPGRLGSAGQAVGRAPLGRALPPSRRADGPGAAASAGPRRRRDDPALAASALARVAAPCVHALPPSSASASRRSRSTSASPRRRWLPGPSAPRWPTPASRRPTSTGSVSTTSNRPRSVTPPPSSVWITCASSRRTATVAG